MILSCDGSSDSARFPCLEKVGLIPSALLIHVTDASYCLSDCSWRPSMVLSFAVSIPWSDSDKSLKNNGGGVASPFPCGSFTFNTLITVVRHTG